MNNQSIVLFLMGPTAIGKSKLSLQIKKKFSQIELLSVDSKLIYKGLDIGTDKPLEKDLRENFYRLVNIIKPQDIYSAIDFYKDATQEIKNILKFGKIPLLVGGTMLYFKILLNGFAYLPPSNALIRNYIYKNICLEKKARLFDILKKIDPVSSKKIHINDVQRVLRAIEIFFVSGGQPRSQLIQSVHQKLPYRIFQFGLIPHNKNILYTKIVRRFYNMLDCGFEKEVFNLYKKKDLNLSFPSINSIGYKQMWLYIQNKCSYQEMIDNTIKSTFHLVKHQLTWLNRWKNITLIYDNQKDLLIEKIQKILQNKN
ncbi:tRNA dimethylallyltransferase [Buchnera aphidicola (Cinara kochiana kochiana)]|uniref:tRNA dimethylallyltransferase n=1 Tax=Buchnera aphidicola (Cinara kochiana kochiana) TaxID=2518976 RepID=A0A451D643_9GAMM|nr:tRNA (adenosine(37)-N6)-dimethylallyltransferase MiaA [Buchnera aphidicola]VFP81276.1 tRNA dimethylallyltransferase [Buchnera aphidicola (Cinara kochiana kochiana)]